MLSSYDILAVWIVFCWAHRVAEEKHPLFKTYSAALNPKDLKCLILDDERAVNALRCVRSFLELRHRSASAPFRNREETVRLAEEFGVSYEPAVTVHLREQRAVPTHIEERYKKIVKKERLLARLDEQLGTLESDLSAATERRQESENRDYHFNYRGAK